MVRGDLDNGPATQRSKEFDNCTEQKPEPIVERCKRKRVSLHCAARAIRSGSRPTCAEQLRAVAA